MSYRTLRWLNKSVCNEGPLYCEYNQIKPSVAIIMFGSQDYRIYPPATFRSNMQRMVEHLLQRGVIPVNTTFPSHPDYHWYDSLVFNDINLSVAAQYNLPVINLWRATQELPDYGVSREDLFHLSEQWGVAYSFNGQERTYGVTLRNLLTLQALDELRRNVLSQ